MCVGVHGTHETFLDLPLNLDVKPKLLRGGGGGGGAEGVEGRYMVVEGNDSGW